MNKEDRLKYFTEKLSRVIELNKRNDKIDSFLVSEIKDDFMTGFMMPITGEYVDMMIDTLAMMWTKDEIIQDWICYYIYETGNMKDKKSKVTVQDKGKEKVEYILDFEDINTFIKFLSENYKLK